VWEATRWDDFCNVEAGRVSVGGLVRR
jgi:hypothetical protein